MMKHVMKSFNHIVRQIMGHKDDSKSMMVTDAVTAFSLRIFGALFSFIFHLYLARKLGAEGAGSFYFALTLALFATIVSRWGIDTSVVRIAAVTVDSTDPGKVKSLYSKSLSLMVLFSLLVTGLILVSLSVSAQFMDISGTTHLTVTGAAILVCPLTILLFQSEILKGVGRVVQSLIVNGLSVPVVCMFLLLLWIGEFSLSSALTVYVVASLVAVGLGTMYWWNFSFCLPEPKQSFYCREILHASSPLLFASSLDIITYWVTVSCLYLFLDASGVGIYGIFYRIVAILNFLLVAVNTVFRPLFAEQYARGDREGLKSLVSFSLFVLLGGGVIVGGGIVLAKPFIDAFLGEQFHISSAGFYTMLVGMFAYVVTGVYTSVLLMSDEYAIMKKILAVSVIISVVANAVLIPLWGVYGGILATSVGMNSQNVVSWLWYRDKYLKN